MKWDQTNTHPRLEEEPLAIAKKEDSIATIFLTKINEKGLKFIWDLKKTII